MAATKIEWTQKTYNPITGCTPISDGCQNCYARRMANRLRGRCGYPEDNPFRVTFHPDRLGEPESWKKPSMIFICSMGDLFHKDVTDEMILQVLRSIPKRHIAQLLTKRPERMAEFFKKYKDEIYTENLWCGTTIESSRVWERVNHIANLECDNRFISCEPLLDDVAAEHPEIFTYEFTDWVIVGGETGPKARPMKPEWVRNIRNRCWKKRMPFFFKRWGSTGEREVDGRIWEQYPHNFHGMEAHALFIEFHEIMDSVFFY